MAAKNNVEVITRFGCWQPEELSFLHANALYIVDCEGAELDLLQPLRCPELTTADIIVECHDWVKSISLPLTERFASTHDVEIIGPQMPEVQAYKKLLDPLPMGTRLLLLTEKRPQPTVWLSLMAKERI